MKRIVILLIAFLTMISAAIEAALKTKDASPKAAKAKGPVMIFILAGQSNMTGRGTLGNLTKPGADQKATTGTPTASATG